MLHELKMWRDRVKQEKIDNADLRAYLLSRHESLCGVHSTLTSALTEVKNAKEMVVASQCPPVQPPRPMRQPHTPANHGPVPQQSRRRTREDTLKSAPSIPEVDQNGDALRLALANEMDDRFARLRSNQHLAPTTKRTGPIHFEGPSPSPANSARGDT
ncbi:hypothetical protein PMAYCL1PPCAC_01996 [Pristionchus mayeri]|uniref:Uncharacterized protein n=1 Tax=Pristionchus mayeri TaxID=1317129 RepID=A0AAN4Z0Z0_9BILA|nr:hypothetical protein PMAYCL1PPCAC_01996 [Pristionchus mayeri]